MAQLQSVQINKGRMNVHSIVVSAPMASQAPICFLVCGPPSLTEEVASEAFAAGVDCQVHVLKYLR
jgi:hypothetical protein